MARWWCVAAGVFLFAVFQVVWFSQHLLAQTAPFPPPVFDFPPSLLSFKLTNHYDFEAQAPGLGIGAQYAGPAQYMDVFYYDHGRQNVPDEVVSPPVQDEIAGTRKVVLQARAAGIWQDVAAKEGFFSSDEPTKLQCLRFELEPQGARVPYDSFLCLKSWRGKFFKMRLTLPKDKGDVEKAKAVAVAWEQYLKNYKIAVR